MPTKINSDLSIVVVNVPGTGRAKVATRISIRVGVVEVAYLTKGLRYSKADAEREWKVNRRLFTITEPGILKLAA